MIRLNIGCGMTPTSGWSNYDGSIAVRLARFPKAASIGRRFRLLNQPQTEYVEFLSRNEIAWADATKRIPHADSTVDVVYASHMLEHFDPKQAQQFLAESMRVLKPGATIRVVVPDFAMIVAAYVKSQDPDEFMTSTGLSMKPLTTLRERIQMLAVGNRGHKWMYDGTSLHRTLERAGFVDAEVLESGKTRIPDPGELDLAEREEASVYVEATRP